MSGDEDMVAGGENEKRAVCASQTLIAEPATPLCLRASSPATPRGRAAHLSRVLRRRSSSQRREQVSGLHLAHAWPCRRSGKGNEHDGRVEETCGSASLAKRRVASTCAGVGSLKRR